MNMMIGIYTSKRFCSRIGQANMQARSTHLISSCFRKKQNCRSNLLFLFLVVGSNNDKNEDSDDGSSKIEETINRMKNIKSEIKKKVKGNIEKAQEKQKQHYDRRRNKSLGFRLNDKVLMRNSRDDDRKGGKLTKSRSGPYLVKECLPKGLYRLSDIKGKPLKRKVNASRLKKYLSNENKNLESSVVDGSGGSQVDMGDSFME